MENAVRSFLRSSEHLKVALEAEITKEHALASSSGPEQSKRVLALVVHGKDYVGDDEEGRCVACFLFQ
jgi:phosphatidylinositol-bisphosphatase